MNILHIGKYFPPVQGGMENFLLDLACACEAAGIDVSVLVHDAPRGSVQPADSHLAIPQVKFPVTRVRTYGQLLYAPVSPGFGRRLAREIRHRKPDLLHVHMPNTSAFWLLAPAVAKIPIVVHWHADVVGSGDRRLAAAYLLYQHLEQALLRRARAVIATSPAYAKASPSLEPWLDKTRIIPLGLDENRLATDADGSQPGWSPDSTLKILAVGRLSRYKGFPYLVRAVQETPGLELIIVGEGEEHDSLQTLVTSGSADSRITLAGSLSEAARNRLMAQCDLLCLPSISRAEAFGLVLLEAMALGKPSLVTRVAGSGMSWVVEDGHNGWHVEPASAGELTQQLIRLRDERPAIARAGQCAIERFRHTFEIHTVAQQIIKLYQGILGAA